MSPVTHFLTGWLVANIGTLSRRERTAVALAGIAPDIDGVGIVAEVLTRGSARPLTWFSDYHHTLHNLAFALVVAAVAFAVATRRWKTAALAFLSFHLHLLGDVLGSRGPDGHQWPIAYLAPLSDAWHWSWEGQWALNAWPNVAITAFLLAATLYLAWRRKFSPLEMVSPRADGMFVQALRRRVNTKQKVKVKR